eukprot:829144-Ditylum_brightwellii.AAC.1
MPITMLWQKGFFATAAIGTGVLKSGVHLCQLVFPVCKVASYNHLICPSIGGMSSDRASDLGNEVDFSCTWKT